MPAARGRRFLTSWLAFGIVFSSVSAFAGPGDKTIVLLEVEGEQTPRLRRSLERMVKSQQHEILPGTVYRDAARRLRATKLTPNNVKKVCAYLKVDGVLDGTVVQDAEGYRFIVRLRSASSGIIEKKFPLRLVQPHLKEATADQLAARLLLAIDNLPLVDKDGEDATRVAAARKGNGAKKRRSAAKDEAEDAEDDELSEVKSSGKGRRGAAVAGKSGAGARAKKSARQDEDEAELEEEEEPGEGTADERVAAQGDEESGDEGEDEVDGSLEDDTDSPAASGSTPRTTALLVNAGVSFIGRKLSFSYSGAAEQGPPGFSGTPVPGAYVVGEVYPAAFDGKRGALADLGVGFVVDRVIKLNSAVDDGTGMATVNLGTRMWRYGANLRYRHNFDAAPNGYSVHGSIGYTSAGFSISKGEAPDGVNVDVPNVGYRVIDAGGGGRIPILEKLSFLAEAKFLAPLDTGPIQGNAQYGPATVMGFEGEAAFEYQITPNFMARAGGRLMLISFSFDGDGALDDRDGNGENDVSGASDRYLGGFVTGGYSF
jgi:hypothetical protein